MKKGPHGQIPRLGLLLSLVLFFLGVLVLVLVLHFFVPGFAFVHLNLNSGYSLESSTKLLKPFMEGGPKDTD